jgi:hypothetical protein
MYDLFKRQRQKKSNLPPFPIKVKKKKHSKNEPKTIRVLVT